MTTTKFCGPSPLATVPKTITLRGACGPGFGRGQMLGRMHLTDKTAPIVVERAFIPESIRSSFTTQPLAWQTRAFTPDVRQLSKWTYVIIDVAVDSVTDPVYTVENLDGSPVQAGWSKLVMNRFILDDWVGVQLSIITGLKFGGFHHRPHPGQILLNFQYADSFDESGRSRAPRQNLRVDNDPIDNDPGWQVPDKIYRAAVAVQTLNATQAPKPADKPVSTFRPLPRINGNLNNAFGDLL